MCILRGLSCQWNMFLCCFFVFFLKFWLLPLNHQHPIATNTTPASTCNYHHHRPSPHSASCSSTSGVCAPVGKRKKTTSASSNGLHHHSRYSTCTHGGGQVVIGCNLRWWCFSFSHCMAQTLLALVVVPPIATCAGIFFYLSQYHALLEFADITFIRCKYRCQVLFQRCI